MSDRGTERAAPDPGGARPRKSDRKHKPSERARGVGAATAEEVAAAARARADDTVLSHGEFITKTEYHRRYGVYKKRVPLPAAAKPPPRKAIKTVERPGGPSLAASSTGGGRNLRRLLTVPVAADAANEEEIKASLTMVCDDTVIDNGVRVPKAEYEARYGAREHITAYRTLSHWLFFCADSVTKSALSKEWFAKTGTPFNCITTLAKAKFFLDFYLPNVVPRFAHSHELSLEEDTNIHMTWDDVYADLAVLFNYGRPARGWPPITGEQLKNLEDPLFYKKEDSDDPHWYADNIQMAAMRVNPINIQTDPSGVPTPDDVARNNGLCPKKLVKVDTMYVPRACMSAARAFEGVVDPKKRGTWLFNNNDPGKPDTGWPTVDRLNAMVYALAFCRIDCGLREFHTRAKLDELGKSAQVCAIETFCPSLLKSAVKAKLPNLSDAELDDRVTPERVAAVVKFVGPGGGGGGSGWRVDKTAAAWREMGIEPADVADRLKEVDKVAEDKGLKARV